MLFIITGTGTGLRGQIVWVKMLFLMGIKHFFVSCFNFGEVELELAQFFAIHFHFQTM